MSAATILGALTTLVLLLYFLALDTLVGGSVLAVNAALRGTPPHRHLLRRLGRLLPISALATALAGAAALVILRAAHGATMSAALPIGFGDRGTVPRLLHVLLAAIAVCGLLVARLALRADPAERAVRAWIVRHGAAWSALATAGNMLVGVLWMLRLPHDTVIRFTGADTGAMLTFSAAIVAGMLALGFTAMALTLHDPRRYLDAAGVALLVTVVAMVRMREMLRPVPTRTELPWGPIVISCALMVAGTCALVQAWRGFGARRLT